jgi:hypothetical protein
MNHLFPKAHQQQEQMNKHKQNKGSKSRVKICITYGTSAAKTQMSLTRAPVPKHDFHDPSDREVDSQQIHQEWMPQPTVDIEDRCAAAAAGCGLGLVVGVDVVVGSWCLVS